MVEKQNVEYKVRWRDECLKWICGYANAEGGVLYIGKDDDGIVVGLSNGKKLLEDIPNKVRSVLGIIVDVNLHSVPLGEFLEIVVSSYPSPVSYKGQFHYRTGSTKQELKGAALNKFLLQKFGVNWDEETVPAICEKDLDEHAFTHFRELAVTKQRLSSDVINEPNLGLLAKLHLIKEGMLTRAALLLFHNDPEKFVTGAFVKVGFFKNDADLIYHDEIHGDLFCR